MSSLVTSLDYHLAVRQGLQFLDSYQQDQVLPEEIDFNLNLQQERFLDHIFSNEFQDHQRRLDYIQNVIVKNKPLTALEFIDTDVDFEENAQYALLPGDYMHLINYRFKEFFDKTRCTLDVQDAWKANYTEYVAVVPFPEDTSGSQPFYEQVRVTLGLGGSGFEAADTTEYDRKFQLSAKEEISPVIQDMLRHFSSYASPNDLFVDNQGLRMYWENYRGVYHANSIIFVYNSNQLTSTPVSTGPVTIQILDGNGNNVNTSQVNFVATTYTTWDETAMATAGLSSEIQQGDMPTQDMMYDWQTQNTFYKPDAQQPQIMLTKEKMYIYVNGKSLINTVRVDYVRRPRQISLSLNQTSELADNAPQRIVDWTIERMKLVLENPNVASMTQHNELKTQ